MILKLKRYYKDEDATDGILTLNGKRICCTAEHTPTCLKPGKYRIQQKTHVLNPAKKVTYPEDVVRIPANIREMPCLFQGKGKKSLGCIRPGNGIHTLHDASIIVGERRAIGLCIHTNETFEKLFSRLRKSWKRKEKTYLLVEDDYEENMNCSI